MARLSWLHLSDLKMTTGGTRLQWPKYREEFERDLRALHQHTGPWDLVLLTGGLTMQGYQGEFAVLNAALETLWSFLRSLGSEPVLLAVPSRSDMESSLSYSWLEHWYEKHPPHIIVERKRESTIENFVVNIIKGDLKVGVVGLKSASLFPNDSLSRLELSSIKGLVGRNVPAWSQEKSCILLLTHLPPWKIHPSSMKSILEQLAPVGEETLLHLCGDCLESPMYKAQIVEKIGRVFQNRSLFGEPPPRKPWAEDGIWGYSVGQLGLKGGIGLIQIFPRAVLPERQERPTFIPDHTFNLDTEKSLTWLTGPSTHRASRKVAHRVLEASRSPTGLALAKTLPTGYERMAWVLWSPSGEELAVGSRSGLVQIWESSTQRLRWAVRAQEPNFFDLCFSPDGKTLATCSASTILAWDARNGNCRRVCNIEGNGLRLTWSSQGLLVAGSRNGSINSFFFDRGQNEPLQSKFPRGPPPPLLPGLVA